MEASAQTVTEAPLRRYLANPEERRLFRVRVCHSPALAGVILRAAPALTSINVKQHSTLVDINRYALR